MHAGRPSKIAEHERLTQAHGAAGTYLSERRWDTVREDVSADGNARQSLTHDQARSRAYRKGEGGIAGISDGSRLCCDALLVDQQSGSDADP
jgi:hypothetical protein